MEIIFYENIIGKYTLFVGNAISNTENMFAELEEHLSGSELFEFHKISNEKRKREWLGVRILLRQILGRYSKIFYDEKGKPYLDENLNVSVSHSTGLIAVLVSVNPDLGVDIEKVSERILKTAHKFTDKTLTENSEKDSLTKFFHLKWGAKETLYKIYGKGIPDYIKHLNVEIPKIEEQGKILGTIVMDDFNKTYDIKYLFFKFKKEAEHEFLLTWSS